MLFVDLSQNCKKKLVLYRLPFPTNIFQLSLLVLRSLIRETLLLHFILLFKLPGWVQLVLLNFLKLGEIFCRI